MKNLLARLFSGGVRAHGPNTSLEDIFNNAYRDSLGWGRTIYADPDYAMREAIVYLCVARICGAVSPLRVEAKTFDSDGGMRPAKADAATKLLNRQPHPMWSAPEFWDWMVASVELWGNAYAHIRRSVGGLPVSIKPYHPRAVTPFADGQRVYYRMIDELPNYNRSQVGETIHAPATDVLHFKNFTQDGLRGYSTLRAAAQSLDYKFYMDRFSRTFYRRGVHSQMAISAEAKLTGEEASHIKAQFLANAEDTRKALTPLVLGRGARVMQLGISPRDAQLLELEEFRSVEIARAFQVPNVLLNMDQKVQAVAKATNELVRFFNHFTIRPKLHRMGVELSRKLAPKGLREYRFQSDEGLPPDEVASLVSALGGQPFLTINEVRRKMGLPTLDGEEYDRPAMMPGTPGGGPAMPADPGGEGNDDGAEDAPNFEEIANGASVE